MTTREFIVALVDAMAWPACVVIACVILREQISGLLGRLNALKVGSTEATFRDGVTVAKVEAKVTEYALGEFDRGRLRGYLESLPRAQRVLIMCYYYEGMSEREIAAVLDMPQGEVIRLHAEIIASLKERLNLDASHLRPQVAQTTGVEAGKTR